MNTFSYENQGSKTYLVYSVGDGETLDNISLEMMTNNQIEGLASLFFTQMDSERYLKYNVSSRVTAKSLIERPVKKKILAGMLLSIITAMQNAEEYMIDTNAFVLDSNYIFVDVTSGNAVLICLPVEECKQEVSLQDFLRSFVSSIQCDVEEDLNYFARIISSLNSSRLFSLNSFKQLLTDIINETPQANVKPQTSDINRSVVTGDKPNAEVKSSIEKSNISKQTSESSINNSNRIHGEIVTNIRDNKQKDTDVPVKENNADDISLLYLLQHYNKENAEKYKAQKSRKKEQQSAANPASAKNDLYSSKNGKSGTPEVNFKIPGFEKAGNNSGGNNGSDNKWNNIMINRPETNQKDVSEKNSPGNGNVGEAAADLLGGTVILDDNLYEETTILTEEYEPEELKPYLIRRKNGESILINKPDFRIGKNQEYSDYCVSDNPTVSRSHARIITREGRYYVFDNASLNHTYVNGTMIPSNTEVELGNNTVIRFSSEEFEFVIK